MPDLRPLPLFVAANQRRATQVQVRWLPSIVNSRMRCDTDPNTATFLGRSARLQRDVHIRQYSGSSMRPVALRPVPRRPAAGRINRSRGCSSLKVDRPLKPRIGVLWIDRAGVQSFSCAATTSSRAVITQARSNSIKRTRGAVRSPFRHRAQSSVGWMSPSPRADLDQSSAINHSLRPRRICPPFRYRGRKVLQRHVGRHTHGVCAGALLIEAYPQRTIADKPCS